MVALAVQARTARTTATPFVVIAFALVVALVVVAGARKVRTTVLTAEATTTMSTPPAAATAAVGLPFALFFRRFVDIVVVIAPAPAVQRATTTRAPTVGVAARRDAAVDEALCRHLVCIVAFGGAIQVSVAARRIVPLPQQTA